MITGVERRAIIEKLQGGDRSPAIMAKVREYVQQMREHFQRVKKLSPEEMEDLKRLVWPEQIQKREGICPKRID